MPEMISNNMNAADALKRRSWSAVEVSGLLDVPVALVERWCAAHVLRAERRAGAWVIPGPALFLFCARRVEPHYSPETVAGLLDRSIETVRGWIKAGRLRTIKLGTARKASVLVPESELRRWLAL